MDELKKRVEEVLKEIRRDLNVDEGELKIVDITSDGVVRIHLGGGCGCCSTEAYFLRLSVDEKLRKRVPEIKEIEQV